MVAVFLCFKVAVVLRFMFAVYILPQHSQSFGISYIPHREAGRVLVSELMKFWTWQVANVNDTVAAKPSPSLSGQAVNQQS